MLVRSVLSAIIWAALSSGPLATKAQDAPAPVPAPSMRLKVQPHLARAGQTIVFEVQHDPSAGRVPEIVVAIFRGESLVRDVPREGDGRFRAQLLPGRYQAQAFAAYPQLASDPIK